jgi:hypothetical protein
MRASIRELMDLLGVGYVMSPCEIYPWSHYDPSKGETCSAEVRTGFDGEEVEAEIQMVFDEPKNGRSIEQILHLRATPKDDKWSVIFLRIRGEDKKGEVYDWETKSCRFFAACAQEIAMGSIPDFDMLLEQEFHDNERMGGGGRGGRKAHKRRADQGLGMKKGGSF